MADERPSIDTVSFEPLPGDDLDLRPLLARLAVGVVVLLLGVGALALVAREPLTLLAGGFVARFGLVGVFLGVLFTDTFVLTHEPILWAGYAGGLGFWSVFVTASAASVSAGLLGWALGGMLRDVAWVQRAFARYRIADFLGRHGFWAVAVAALTPFPFSVATWASGAARVPVRIVLLGSLFRVPKVLFYFVVIVLGWNAGGLLDAP